MTAPAPAGLNLVGYLDHILGQGEAARRFGEGLDAAGVPWSGFALSLPVPTMRPALTPALDPAKLPYSVTALWCNPDRYGLDVTLDAALTTGRYTIGCWAWELETIPLAWRDASRMLDEIWVSSVFVADAVRDQVEIPVTVVPLPISADPAVAPIDRGALGVADDAFLFLSAFDYHSTIARKNPLGAIEAYRRAFGPGDGAALVVKSVNAPSRAADAAAIARAVEGREDIRVIDAPFSEREQAALLAACDCCLSLHRSEGFAIALAQAIALGHPVIATGFGGNLEFMDDRDDLLVDHRLVSVGPGAEPYPPAASWAEPDLDHAAMLMRGLVADPVAAAARGRAGAERLARRFAPPIAGAAAADHTRRAHAALVSRDRREVHAVRRRPV